MLPLNANDLFAIKNLLDSRQSGHGLPRQFYHDELLYRLEMDFIWLQGWLFAGHSCQIPNPGDYFLYEIKGIRSLLCAATTGR